VLNDIAPLRSLTRESIAAGTVLLPPSTAYRINANQNRDTPLPLDEPRTANPPAGAVIDYVLPAAVRGPVVLDIVDGQGKVVRSFRSDQTPQRPEAGQYFSDEWLQPPAPLPARPGHNRFVWDLHGPRPRALEYQYSIAAMPGADTPELPQGIFVLPGTYQVRLTVDGRTATQPLTVVMDPRVHVPPADLKAQNDFYEEVAQALARVTEAQEQVQAAADRLKGKKGADAERLAAQVAAFQGGRRGGSEDNLATIAGVLSPLATDIESGDHAPTKAQREVYAMYGKRLETALAHWQALKNGPLRGQ
jgi:hypothetical protein